MRRHLSHDRIIFNGNDLSNLVMCRMERSIMPPVEISRETIGSRHGELYRRGRMTGFTIPVTVWPRTTNRRDVAEIRHKLAALLWTDKPAPLYLPDDPTRYYLATVENDTGLGPIVDGVMSTTIEFYVCDPIAYGNARTEALTAGTSKTIDAGGTWESEPVITSKTSGGTWKITNVTTGDFVEINADTVGASIASNKAIMCDMANERFTYNGNDVGVSLDSNFFCLDGRTELLVTGGTGTKVDWRERWI